MAAMTTLAPPAIHSSATRQLAENLGLVLDDLLERTAQGFLERIRAHGLSLMEARVLRSLDRSHNPVRAEDVAARAGLEPETAARAVAGLRDRDLVIDVGAGRSAPGALTLTRHGRAIVRDLDFTRRTDLQAFIESLDPTERRRVEAAVSLLNGEL
jgi:DNA-binding MarR family transcriptional regulator